ncbi:MAG: hypothetical protein Q9182_001448 [Xanthomendoza sp. 2 TL-2023]
MAIGTSFVITKKGLLEASERHGFEGDGFAYLKSPTWWGGIATMVIGEVANFAAYAFAPAILVTPLGALSVLIGAVLGAYFLKEELGILGKLGCAMCLIGSVIIVLHAPPDKDITTVDEILQYAIHPGQRTDGNFQDNQFSTSLVNPLYYVTFTTATLCASFILFRGFNTTDAVNTISLLSGFLVIFTGVYLLNLSRGDPNGHKLLRGKGEDGIPTDGITGLQTRASMQARRSGEGRRVSNGSAGFSSRGDREGLMQSYDEENGGFGLTDLTEDSEEEHETPRPSVNGRIHQNQRYSKVQEQ